MRRNPPGYSTITFVIIMAGIILSASIFLHARLRNDTSGLALMESRELAGAGAESCLNEGLLRLQRNRTYAGGELNINGALCRISIDATSTGFDIHALGEHDAVQRTFSLRVEEQAGFLVPTRFRELP